MMKQKDVLRSEDLWSTISASVIIVVALLVFSNLDSPLKSPVFKWSSLADLTDPPNLQQNLAFLLPVSLLMTTIAGVSVHFMGLRILHFIPGFLVLFLLALLALFTAGQAGISQYGIEYVIFALMLGLVLNNLFRLPDWVKSAARSEFYIKTGLILLGSSVLFKDIVQAGPLGILQAVLVVVAVWYVSIWISRRLKLDDEFSVILAAAVSICGVSAAIVAAGAIGGDKRKLSYVTTLVLLVAIPMLLLQPWIIKAFEIPQQMAGAWLGGTLDTTASVTAAAELVGPEALKTAVIIKFSQNVLIGFAAVFIATWWSLRNDKNEVLQGHSRFSVIWERFPKFVLAFLAASLLFSFVITPTLVKPITGFLNQVRTIWFALAFVSIGMEANFSDLFRQYGSKPALSFVTSQIFNIFWTLLIAYLLFAAWS
jgi:uncharacterized integral membrane protein (TIGR00698 family)